MKGTLGCGLELFDEIGPRLGGRECEANVDAGERRVSVGEERYGPFMPVRGCWEKSGMYAGKDVKLELS